MKEKLSLEEFVNLREEDGDATLNFLNEEIEIDWEEDGMEIEGNTLNFSSKLDFLMIEGADNLIPIRSGQKILLSTNNWKRPMPTKRMKMEKDETSFYLGKSKFGEDIFIILSKVNVGKEEFEMKEW